MPHRYWRISFWMGQVTDSANATVSLSEVEMRGSIGGADLTGSGTASAVLASGNAGSGVVANVFDNNTGTSFVIQHFYNPHPEYQHIVYDFGAGSPVDIAEMTIRSGGASANTADRASIWYSDDNTTWVRASQFFDVSALRTINTTVTLNGFVASGAEVYRALTPRHRLNVGWTPDPTLPTRAPGRVALPNLVDGGGYEISGTVAIDDTPDIPVRRQVRLFEKATGRLLRETFSAANGAYSFEKIPNRTYFVVAHDVDGGEYNAVIADKITPELM